MSTINGWLKIRQLLWVYASLFEVEKQFLGFSFFHKKPSYF